jgi:hypothetical protein
MGKNERKLSEKESQRKERFDRLCADMERKGYTAEPMTVGVVKGLSLILCKLYTGVKQRCYF